MDNTGERYIPHAEREPEIAYEHWHRYLYATPFAAGKAVLDVAAGEGYGSHALAAVAARVVGVELDSEAVRLAASRYVRGNLEFRCGSVEAVPVPGEHVFDVVISFETIEHLWESQQRAFLREVRRLLKPGGVLLVSTPNKLFYSDLPRYKNEFHRKEFYPDEYLRLLREHFRVVHLLGQKVYPVSYIWRGADAEPRVREYQLTRSDGHYRPVADDRKEALYLLAVCSDAEAEAPAGSVLLDLSGGALADERARGARQQGEIRRLTAELDAKNAELAARNAEPAAKNQEVQLPTMQANPSEQRAIEDLRKAFEDHVREEAHERRVQELARQNEAVRGELAALQRQTETLAKENQNLQHQAQALAAENGNFQRQTQAVEKENENLRRHGQELGKDGDALRQRVQELARENEVVRGEIAGLQRQIEDCARKEDGLQRQVQELTKDRDTLQRQAQELAREGEVDRRALEELRGHAAALAKENEAGRGEIDALRQYVQTLTKLNENLQRGAQETAKEQEAGRAEISRLQGHAQDLAKEINKLEEQAQALARENESLRNHAQELGREGECLQRQGQELRNENDALRRQAQELTEEGANLRRRAEEADRENDGLRRRVQEVGEENDGLRRQAEEFGSEGEALRRRGDELDGENNDLRRQIEELGKEGEDLRRRSEEFAEENDGLRRQAAALAEELEAAQRAHAELERDGEALGKDNAAWQHEYGELERRYQELAGQNEALEGSVLELTRENETDRKEAVDSRQAAEEREAQVLELTARLELMTARENELREMLLEAHDQLLRRDEELQAAVAGVPYSEATQAGGAAANGPVVTGVIAPHKAPAAGAPSSYQDLVHAIREAVHDALPPDATVAVVSKGDGQLLLLEGRRGWHFPQDERGVYAGYNPADGAAAVAHLEELRGKGAEYLLFPATALWWLEHYADFRQHLDGHYRRVVDRPDVCVLFGLQKPEPTAKEIYGQLVHQIREVTDGALPAGAAVLVVSKGDEALLELNGRSGWHFPQDERGVYAGYNPADGAAAVAHLEELRGEGAEYLLFPATALWWLEHYADFRRHLDGHYRRVVDRPDVCVIFALRAEEAPHGRHQEPAARPREKGPRPFGLNVSGLVTSEKGGGEVLRANVRSARAVHIPYVLNNFVDVLSANLETAPADCTDENPYCVNLIHLNHSELPAFMSERGEDYFRGRYNIGYWNWELSDFPKEWQDDFRHFDEIWVLSNFVQDAIARVSPIPVVRVPPSLRDDLVLQTGDRSHYGLSPDTFVFLFLFDFQSIVERKNPFGLIKAFRKAFRKDDDALLVLKCSRSTPEQLRAVRSACQGANVLLLDSVVTREEVNALLHLADCYVSLHRSEGFGLTLVEAMSIGKPVIATGYSGNMDFMTASNSYPVKYRLVELGQDYPPYKKGCVWADPDLDHAAELMRFTYEHRDVAVEVGRIARRDLARSLSPRVIGGQIKERLARLAAFGKIDGPAGALNGRSGAPAPAESRLSKALKYQRVLQQLRDVAGAALPPLATVAVVSKGDEDVLQLGGRRAWHFPRGEDGRYAGHYPATDAEAVAHLEELRAQGAQYLLFPGTALWWLDHYADFRRHLDAHYRRVADAESCVIYELAAGASAAAPETTGAVAAAEG